MKVVIVSTLYFSDFMSHVNKKYATHRSKRVELGCIDFESSETIMEKINEKIGKVDAYVLLSHDKSTVDNIIRTCRELGVEVEFNRLEIHYDGNRLYVEDIETVLSCGDEIL